MDESWPALPLNEWRDTCDTLHMWTQVVGKTRLALTPLVNHWLECTSVRHAAGIEYVANSLRVSDVRGGIRFHQPQTGVANQ
jgi:hypothetical protein